MEIHHTDCAGLDVHKKVVVATIIVSNEHGQLIKETHSFETMTAGLTSIAALLKQLLRFWIPFQGWRVERLR